ncbi:hypothetical protein C8R47DRAFT_1230515 [Mycena vitilis]|nr:hypothetical protein C8R47DRAFT_1230515 [Mycena vitilis]
MALNLCRAIVVYMPVWKPATVLFDEDGNEIPGLMPATDIIFPTYIHIDASFRLPPRRPHPEYCGGEAVEHAWTLERGETFKNLNFARSGRATFCQLILDTPCRHICKCACHADASSTRAPCLVMDEPRTLSSIDAADSDSDTDSDTDTAVEAASDTPSNTTGITAKACDFCSASLAGCRFFRCGDCDESPTLQCESCCFELHLCRRRHELQEWSEYLGNWVSGNIETTCLGDRFAVHCGSCCVELAPAGRGIPRGAIFCPECDSGLVCRDCCKEDHRCKPLHSLKQWTGQDWEGATLRDIGFVYQLGHRGDPCSRPTAVVWPMLVISMRGCHFLNLKYCACGKFPWSGAKGRWAQVMYNGWFASSLKHTGVCTTFRVWPDVN